MSPHSTDIESDNDIKRYAKRPKSLENWCLADYISQLEIKYPKKLNQDLPGSDEDNSDNNEVQHNDTGDEDTNEQTTDDSRDRINITLNNGITIKQRKSFRVIRYVRYNKKTDSEQYFRERLLLFYRWRSEWCLKGNHETYEQMYNSVKYIVDNKAKQYEHNAE